MEDDLKILNVEYLSNHWSDLIQILKLNQGDQTKVYRILKLKTTLTEDDLKIINVEYLLGVQRFFSLFAPQFFLHLSSTWVNIRLYIEEEETHLWHHQQIM
jgi:hypothetical protein